MESLKTNFMTNNSIRFERKLNMSFHLISNSKQRKKL